MGCHTYHFDSEELTMELRSGRLAAMATAATMAGEWEPVPDELGKSARIKLRWAETSEAEARVNMRSQHPLAKWGRDKRKEKVKAKIAAASRRRNRR
jgi:hypothetical protein